MSTQALRKYSVATEFTKYPGGRLIKDGPFSGELFRESVLIPLLSEYDHLIIDLSGTKGYGSSFLDESFGGLAQKISEAALRARVTLFSDDDPLLIDVIWAKVHKAVSDPHSK